MAGIRHQHQAHQRPAQARRTRFCHSAHARYKTVRLLEYVPAQRRVTFHPTGYRSRYPAHLQGHTRHNGTSPVKVIDYTPGYLHWVRRRVLVQPARHAHHHNAYRHTMRHGRCPTRY